MKLSGLIWLCLVVWAVGVRAQDAPDDPKGGTIVDCAPENVAVFPHTESPDGHYALGWTVRPKPGQPPVDWSSYDRNQPGNFLDKYPVFEDDSALVKYTLVDGVLDLRAEKFTPLATDFPYWPRANRAAFGVEWSGDQPGTRYAIVNNDQRFGTVNLWLITVDACDIRAADLAPAAIKAVRKSIRARTRQSDLYETAFIPRHSPEGGKPLPTAFKGHVLKLSFDAEIPKSVDDRGYAGEITIALPAGTITRVRSRVSR